MYMYKTNGFRRITQRTNHHFQAIETFITRTSMHVLIKELGCSVEKHRLTQPYVLTFSVFMQNLVRPAYLIRNFAACNECMYLHHFPFYELYIPR